MDFHDRPSSAPPLLPKPGRFRPAVENPSAKIQHSSKLFGIPGYSSWHAGGRSFDYDAKYPEDPPGEEDSENARIWMIYNDEAGIYDDDMIRGFRDTLDSLLVFAALFSAVVTTLLVETVSSLEPDYAQMSTALLAEQVKLLRANGNATALELIPPSNLVLNATTPSSSEVIVNILFFMSLAVALSTALFSVLFKQWLTAYSTKIPGTPKEMSLIRHFRYDGLVKWKVAEMIGLLPFLLHASVGLFAVGLLVYIRQRNAVVFTATVAVFGTTGVLYLTSILLPPLFPECPYHTSLLDASLRFFLANAWILISGSIQWLTRSVSWLFGYAMYPPSFPATLSFRLRRDWERDLAYKLPHNICGAIIWLHTLSSNPTSTGAVAKSLAGILPYDYAPWGWLGNRRIALELSSIVPFVSHRIWQGIAASTMTRPLPTSPEEVRAAIEPTSPTYNPWVRADFLLNSWIYFWYHDQKLITNRRTLDDGLGNVRYRLSRGVYGAEWYPTKELRTQWLKYFLCCRQVLNPYTGQWALRDHDWNVAQHLTAMARFGRTEIIKLIVSEFPDAVNSVNVSQVTSVYQAASGGHLDTVKVLVEAGADLTLGNPLVAACTGNHIEVVRYLLDHPSSTATAGFETIVEESPFYWAITENDDALVQLLVEKRVRVSLNVQGQLLDYASKSALDSTTLGILQEAWYSPSLTSSDTLGSR